MLILKQSCKAPLDQIPIEILCEIFYAYFALHAHSSRTQAALCLSHVSQRWNLLAQATPALWSFPSVVTDKNIGFQDQLLQISLYRSQQCPLHVLVAWHTPSTEEVYGHADGHIGIVQEWARVLRPLFATSYLWRTASLLNLPVVLVVALRQRTPLPLPLLSSLKVTSWTSYSQIFGPLHSLDTVVLLCPWESALQLPWAGLSQVTLQDEGTLLHALRSSPNLSSAILDNRLLPWESRHAATSTPFPHPNLRALTLSNVGDSAIGQQIELTGLQELVHIKAMWDAIGGLDYHSFLGRVLVPLTSSGSLHTLVLYFHFRWTNVFVDDLRNLFTTNLHSLRSLEIRQTLRNPDEIQPLEHDSYPKNIFQALLPPNHNCYPFGRTGRAPVLSLPLLTSLEYHINVQSLNTPSMIIADSRPDVFHILETLEEVVSARFAEQINATQNTEIGLERLRLRSFTMKTSGISPLKLAFFNYRMGRFRNRGMRVLFENQASCEPGVAQRIGDPIEW